MATFNDLWQMLYDHGSSNYHKHDCAELWNSLTPEKQQALFDSISERLRRNQYVAYNPLEAMNDNMPRAQIRRLTYGEYYSTYGTTEAKDGWELRKAADGKVYYEKAAHNYAANKC